MNGALFRETIENWKDWGRVFQSVEAFTPLAEEICRREGLPFSPLQNLTPGTNAVFQMGNMVIKLFFPKESGLDPLPDFQNEAAVCGWLTERQVPTPRLLAKGKIQDKYEFPYLIFSFAAGTEAGNWLKTAGEDQKAVFVRQLKEILCKLNQPVSGLIPTIDLRERAIHNFRLNRLPETLQADIRRRVEELDLRKQVLVHGDLTGENLLVTPQGKLIVIDCADACLAPAWYELGPIVFELFRCDPVLLRAFVKSPSERETFVKQVLDSICLHDFGADLLREAAERAGIPLFSRLSVVKDFLLEKI